MKNLKAKLGSAFSYGFVPAIFFVTIGMMEAQIAARETVMVDGVAQHVNVMRDHTISFDLSNVRTENGQFVTQTGIPASKGRPPIIYNRPSTPYEIAVYRSIF